MSNIHADAGDATLRRIGMIWAEANGVIGADGAMPWSLPEDLAHFQRVTQGNAVIMGRKTWDSLPARARPLPGRTNIVITRDTTRPAASESGGVIFVTSALDALEAARASEGEDVWVIGGAQIYALFASQAQIVVRTVIDILPEGDTMAPVLGNEWIKMGSEPISGWITSANGTKYRFETWERRDG